MSVESSGTKQSFGEIIKWARDTETRWTRSDGELIDVWFRGHANSAWNLQPVLHRFDGSSGRITDERSLFLQFTQLARAYKESVSSATDWDLYCLARHHGLPSRLLDWSRGLAIATYFALCDQLEQPSYTYERVRAMSEAIVQNWKARRGRKTSRRRGRAAPKVNREEAGLRKALLQDLKRTSVRIWMLDAGSVNDAFSHDWAVYAPGGKKTAAWLPASNDRPGRVLPIHPIALFPPQHDPRIIAQKGMFTCHGSDATPLEALAETQPKLRLASIEISGAWKLVVWHQLWLCGVTRDTVFPELGSAVAVLSRVHTGRVDHVDVVTPHKKAEAPNRRTAPRRGVKRAAKKKRIRGR